MQLLRGVHVTCTRRTLFFFYLDFFWMIMWRGGMSSWWCCLRFGLCLALPSVWGSSVREAYFRERTKLELWSLLHRDVSSSFFLWLKCEHAGGVCWKSYTWFHLLWKKIFYVLHENLHAKSSFWIFLIGLRKKISVMWHGKRYLILSKVKFRKNMQKSDLKATEFLIKIISKVNL